MPTTSATHTGAQVGRGGGSAPAAGGDRLARTLAAVPAAVAAGTAAFGVVCVAALLLHAFVAPLVLLAGGAAAALAVVLAGRGTAVPVAQRGADLLALLGAGTFAFVHSWFASQNIVVGRDPGVYAVTARWLMDHRSLRIDAAPEVFGPGFEVASAGFGHHPVVEGELFAQGAHLLPALLAVAGWLGGESVLFKANVVIGGLALLAVYGFARRLVGPWWALAAAVALGLSLPQIAFSRDTYTEPVSQLLVFGGLALLWQARADGSATRHALAGLTLAASTLARVDAYLVLPALVGFGAVVLALSGPPDRRAEVRRVLALAAGAAVPPVLGWLDLVVLSSGYYATMRADLGLIGGATVVALLLGVALVAAAWRTSWLARVDAATRGWRAPAALAGVVVLAAVLASRPLWLVARQADAGPATAYLSGLQDLAGQAVDPRRTYAEHSASWLVWYLGLPLALLAVAGLGMLAARCARGRTQSLPFLLLFGLTALLYLLRPSIVPDHVWAMRRYLPVVLPGLAVAAVVAAAAAVRLLPRRGARAAVAAGVVVLLWTPPLLTSQPVFSIREGTPQLTEARRVCDALPEDAAVVVVGRLAGYYPQTVRSFCGVPASSLAEPEPEVLAEGWAAAREAGRALHVVLDGQDLGRIGVDDGGAAPAPRPVSAIELASRRATLTAPPDEEVRTRRQLYVGEVGPDGAVVGWAG